MQSTVRIPILFFIVLCVLLLSSCESAPPVSSQAGQTLVYFGTYTRGDSSSKGIYVSRMDSATGELSAPELAAETPNPSFLAIHPNREYLYSVSEMVEGQEEGAVSAFRIDRDTGKLTPLNTVSARGGMPCHINVDQTGRTVVVANYGTGSVAAFPVSDDGSLGEASAFVQHEGSSVNPKRQQGPHAHSVDISADNRFVIGADLGLDKVLVYRLDPANGTLEPNDPPHATVAPGSGPRHFAFHPNNRFGYVLGEIASTVTAFSYDGGQGSLTEIETVSTLPEGFDGRNSTAEIFAHPSGKFLYSSNRGHDSITVYAIDGDSGTLTVLEHVSTQGETPRSFGIDPTGRFLIAANQRTGNVVGFRIDQNSGKLTPTGQQLQVGAPVCVRFVEP